MFIGFLEVSRVLYTSRHSKIIHIFMICAIGDNLLYGSLRECVNYNHRIVVSRRCFVDPVTDFHVNNVDSLVTIK